MIKDISYSGLSTVPSDYEAPDGHLAAAVNIIPEDGALRRIYPPSVHFTPPAGHTPVFIHKLSGGEVFYILFNNDDDTLSAIKQNDTEPLPILTISADSTLTQITAIGNTLVILTSAGIYFAKWDNISQSYQSLPAEFPEFPLQFSLTDGKEEIPSFDIPLATGLPDWRSDLSDESKTTITNAVLGQINKAIAEAAQQGRFVLPFFVRYALRLYDGTLVNHSAPVLIRPVIGDSFSAAMSNLNGKISHIHYVSAKLAWQMPGQPYKSFKRLAQWKDLISSIDIFVSAPIYDFNADDFIIGVSEIEAPANSGRYRTCYTHNNVASGNAREPLQADYGHPIILPRLDTDNSFWSRAAANANFYLVKSIPVEYNPTNPFESWKSDTIGEDILPALVTREPMTDDYGTSDSYIARNAFVYNARLNIADVTKLIRPRADVSLAAQYIGGGTLYKAKAYIFARRDSGSFVCASNIFDFEGEIPFFYHQCSGAYRLLIVRTSNSAGGEWQQYLDLQLKPHEFLNGAYFCRTGSVTNKFDAWLDVSDSLVIPDDSELSPYIPEQASNKLYSSAVNNPFFIPASSAVTIGNSQILGLSSAAKALSQGQFGQFPLYAFTKEGVWALQVSETGTFSARQPITRDVCCNPQAITQLDSSVVFPTQRGIMLLSGSQTQCISEPINSQYPFNVLTLPAMEDIHAEAGHDADACIPLQALSTFLESCRMIYDYPNQRILVYTPTDGPVYNYAYVYSLKSYAWATMRAAILSTLNSYPGALAVAHDGTIIDFCTPDTEDNAIPILVTRPLALDAPDVLKTVDTVIQRGNFRRGHVQSILYASRDLFNWHLVWSSQDHTLRGFRGSPYKYFRIALICHLDPGESISNATIQFTPRQTNKPR